MGKENVIDLGKIPLDRKLSAAFESNQFVCVWVNKDGSTHFLHKGMSLPALTFAQKIIDMEVTKGVIKGEETKRD